MWPLEHKRTHWRCPAQLCAPRRLARSSGRDANFCRRIIRSPTRKSVVAKDTTSPRFNRSSDAEQTLVPTVQDKSQTLVGDAKQACRAGYASTRRFQSPLDQVTLVLQHLLLERTAGP